MKQISTFFATVVLVNAICLSQAFSTSELPGLSGLPGLPQSLPNTQATRAAAPAAPTPSFKETTCSCNYPYRYSAFADDWHIPSAWNISSVA